MTRHPTPRYRAPVKRRDSRRTPHRKTNPYALTFALVALAAIAWAAWTLGARAARPGAAGPAPKPVAIAQEARVGTGTPVTHVTFGAHTRANQPCESCHAPQPGGEISCRTCHGDVCGKDAKTVSDCIECHKKGTTDEWASGAQE